MPYMARLRSAIAVILSAICIIISSISWIIELLVLIQALRIEIIESSITAVVIGLTIAFILTGIILNTRLRLEIIYSLRALTSLFLTFGILGLITLFKVIPENLKQYLGAWRPIADAMSDIALPILIVFVVLLLILYGIAWIRESQIKRISLLRTVVLNITSASSRIRDSTVKSIVERHIRNMQQILADMAKSIFIDRWDASRILWSCLLLTSILIGLIIVLPKYIAILSWSWVLIIVILICIFLVIADSLRVSALRAKFLP